MLLEQRLAPSLRAAAIASLVRHRHSGPVRIVTGDADVLTIGNDSSVEIISPRQFVARQIKTGRC